jgi:hypothetical protein
MKLRKNYTQIGCQVFQVIVKVIKVVMIKIMMMSAVILDTQHHRKAEREQD